VGWVACQDQRLLTEVQAARSILSGCLATPSEVLAHIALLAEARVVERSKSILESNRRIMELFLTRHFEVFAWRASGNGAFVYLPYLGMEGAERFALELAREAGILVLPSSLWRSPLAQVAENHVRIGLGRIGAGTALQALSGYLASRGRLAAAS